MKAKNVLPDLPSEILMVALEDLITVENNPKFKIDMGTWYNPGRYRSDRCLVCHAGAVMACRLDFDKSCETEPDELNNKSITAKLEFINRVRVGYIHDGLETLCDKGVIDEEQFYRAEKAIGRDKDHEGENTLHVPKDASNYSMYKRDAYKNYIIGVIGILQAEGL